jgi:hypothetical protein
MINYRMMVVGAGNAIVIDVATRGLPIYVFILCLVVSTLCLRCAYQLGRRRDRGAHMALLLRQLASYPAATKPIIIEQDHDA